MQNYIALFIVLWVILVFAAFTLIGLFLLVRKEEGTTNPIEIFTTYFQKLRIHIKACLSHKSHMSHSSHS